MIKRVYKEESDKRKTIDKIADACIIERSVVRGKKTLVSSECNRRKSLLALFLVVKK